jgi:hypothetical protein
MEGTTGLERLEEIFRGLRSLAVAVRTREGALGSSVTDEDQRVKARLDGDRAETDAGKTSPVRS